MACLLTYPNRSIAAFAAMLLAACASEPQPDAATLAMAASMSEHCEVPSRTLPADYPAIARAESFARDGDDARAVEIYTDLGRLGYPRPQLEAARLLARYPDQQVEAAAWALLVSDHPSFGPQAETLSFRVSAEEQDRVVERRQQLDAVIDANEVPIDWVQPTFPRVAVKANREGWIILRLWVEPSGSVGRADVLAVHPEGRIGDAFRQSALEAAREMRYRSEIRSRYPPLPPSCFMYQFLIP